jgi:hypothetical protein
MVLDLLLFLEFGASPFGVCLVLRLAGLGF